MSEWNDWYERMAERERRHRINLFLVAIAGNVAAILLWNLWLERIVDSWLRGTQ